MKMWKRDIKTIMTWVRVGGGGRSLNVTWKEWGEVLSGVTSLRVKFRHHDCTNLYFSMYFDYEGALD
jgi:hypothetical protein